MMSDLQILLFCSLSFTFLAFYYYYRVRKINIAFFFLFYYSIVAWGAVLYYNHELFELVRGKATYTLSPFLYLIPAILLYTYPILKYDNTKIQYVETVPPTTYMRVVKILFFVQIVLYIILLPAVLKALLSSNIGDFRDSQYDEAEMVKFPHYIFNVLCRLYMGCRHIAIFIAVYGLLTMKTNRKFLKIFFITSTFFPIYIFTAYASRATMVMTLFLMVFVFVFFYYFIQNNIRRKIVGYLFATSIPIVAMFTYISNSRFGNMATYMFYRYIGESFNNYNTQFFHDLDGNTWGDAYFTLFAKLLGSERNFYTTREKWAYLDNITGVDTHVFYTFIGGLNIEFGLIGTIIIGIVLVWYLNKMLYPNMILTLPKLIILGMLAYTLINGAFFFVLQGDWGNLEILFTILFCYLFSKYRTKKYIEV